MVRLQPLLRRLMIEGYLRTEAPLCSDAHFQWQDVEIQW